MGERAIVLYDGTCGLCSSAVQFLLNADRRGALLFAALGTPAAAIVTGPFGGPPAGIDSIIVVTECGLFVRSDAALELARRLLAPWPLLGRIAGLVPRIVRDAVYDGVARTRHRWPTRSCRVPTAEQHARFL